MAFSNPVDIAEQALRFTGELGCEQCGGRVGLQPIILDNGDFIQLCKRCRDALSKAQES